MFIFCRCITLVLTTCLQVAKPLWPFMVAGSITIYYVAKIQDAAVRCASCEILLLFWPDLFHPAPEYAKDPKNPYATKIANESASH